MCLGEPGPRAPAHVPHASVHFVPQRPGAAFPPSLITIHPKWGKQTGNTSPGCIGRLRRFPGQGRRSAEERNCESWLKNGLKNATFLTTGIHSYLQALVGAHPLGRRRPGAIHTAPLPRWRNTAHEPISTFHCSVLMQGHASTCHGSYKSL